MSDVIQHSPEYYGDRAASLLLLQRLEQERQRIEAELQAVNARLLGTIHNADITRQVLAQASRELSLMIDKLDHEIEIQRALHPPPEHS